MGKNRNSFVELLRIVFMFFIVVTHAYVHGHDGDIKYVYEMGSNIATLHHYIIFLLCQLGVSGFIFISVFYGVSCNRCKFTSLLSTCVFYYIIMTLLFGGSIGKIFHVWDTWWFVNCYLLLMILAPIINAGFENLSFRRKTFVVIFLLFYTYVGHFYDGEHNFSLMITIYILGRFICTWKTLSSSRIFFPSLWLCVVLTIGYVVCGLALSAANAPYHVFCAYISNNNFFVIVVSVMWILYAVNHPFNCRVINSLASSSLVIYLVSDFHNVRPVLDPWLLDNILKNVGFVYAFLGCLLILLLDKIRIGLLIIIKKLLPAKCKLEGK